MGLLGGYFKIMLSSSVIYLFIIIAIRLFGKKELAQLSVIDLVFILLISNAVQNAMVGSDSTVGGGIVAAASLFAMNYVLKQILYKFPWFSKVIQGEPIMLIYNGKLSTKNMERAKVTRSELMEAIREHGVSTIEEVDLAIFEVDGNISILSNEFKNRTVKKRRLRKQETKE
ncbi:MAG: DUF421 domain-containing protein [Clostridiales bacterium]|nr:DUF421 domain-containing protein [Clostridiales bacterium]HBM81921.1 DUF421 domain-containing protein [Clostridiaceae bacterium]